MPQLKKYHASCHCGEIQFEFECELITKGCRCNCSICRRKGATMSDSYIEPEKFSLLKGKQSLQRYQFGDHDVYHYFCKTCGIYPFHDGPAFPGKYRVNLGCVEDLDLDSLEIRKIDGASF